MVVLFWQVVRIKDLLGVAGAMWIQLKVFHCMTEKVRVAIPSRTSQLYVDIPALVLLYLEVMSDTFLQMSM